MTTARTETGLIFAWLRATLGSDAALAAFVTEWSRNAPRIGGAYPIGVIRFQSGFDLAAIGADRRVWVESVYAIYIVDAGTNTSGNDIAPATQAAAVRIDQVLLGAQSAVDGGRIVSVTRDGPIEVSLTDNGIHRAMVGGTYRIRAQRS